MISTSWVPKDHINIGILQSVISGIPLHEFIRRFWWHCKCTCWSFGGLLVDSPLDSGANRPSKTFLKRYFRASLFVPGPVCAHRSLGTLIRPDTPQQSLLGPLLSPTGP